MCAHLGVDRINLLGICQGGTFSLCYAALHPERVANLVTMVTPVDFHTPDNLLTRWIRHVDIDALWSSWRHYARENKAVIDIGIILWRLPHYIPPPPA